MPLLDARGEGVSCRPGGIDLTGYFGRAYVPALNARYRSAVCTSLGFGLLYGLVDIALL